MCSLNGTEVPQSEFVAQEELFEEHRNSGCDAHMAKSNINILNHISHSLNRAKGTCISSVLYY